MWNVECGMWNSWWSLRDGLMGKEGEENVECGMWNVECGMWNVEFVVVAARRTDGGAVRSALGGLIVR